VGRRGLDVGTVDADNSQLAGGLAVPAGRHQRHGAAYRRHNNLWDGHSGVALAHQRRGAGRGGLRRELVTIDLEPGDSKEKRAVGDVTRVVGEASDLGGWVAAHRGAGNFLYELSKLHRRGFYQTPSPRRCARAAVSRFGCRRDLQVLEEAVIF
jgi:hypothetical protein